MWLTQDRAHEVITPSNHERNGPALGALVLDPPPAWATGISRATRSPSGSSLPASKQTAFGKDGSPTVVISTYDWPLPAGQPTEPVRGLPSTIASNGRLTTLTIAMRPGRTVALSSGVLDEAELRGLVDAVDLRTGDVLVDRLPDGLGVVDGAAYVLDFGSALTAPPWPLSIVDYRSEGGATWQQLSVGTAILDDAEPVLNELCAFWGCERVRVRGRRGVYLAETTGDGPIQSLIVWEDSPGRLGLVAASRSPGTPTLDIAQLAETTRAATRAEWDSLQATVAQPDPGPSRQVNGVTIYDAAGDVAAKGQLGDRWWILQYNPPGGTGNQGGGGLLADAWTVTVRNPDGSQDGGGFGGGGLQQGWVQWRGSRTVGVLAQVDEPVERAVFVLDGTEHEAAVIALEATGKWLVLALLESVDTPDLGGPPGVDRLGRFVVSRPDGTTYEIR